MDGNLHRHQAGVAIVLALVAMCIAAIAGWLTSQPLCPSAQNFPDTGYRTAVGVVAALALFVSVRSAFGVVSDQQKPGTGRMLVGVVVLLIGWYVLASYSWLAATA